MKNYQDDGCLPIILFAGLLLLMIAWNFFASHQEAESYRKFCDRDVTAWDALWLDLRIDECEKRK